MFRYEVRPMCDIITANFTRSIVNDFVETELGRTEGLVGADEEVRIEPQEDGS